MKSPPLAMHWWALASCPSVAGWSQSQQELHAGITPGSAESAKKLMFNRVTWTITISIFKVLGNLNHHKWDCKVLRDLRKDYSTVTCIVCQHARLLSAIQTGSTTCPTHLSFQPFSIKENGLDRSGKIQSRNETSTWKCKKSTNTEISPEGISQTLFWFCVEVSSHAWYSISP